MTASFIAPKLFQGSFPKSAAELRQNGIHTLILCAAELQPPDSEFSGIEVLRCPFHDEDTVVSRELAARVLETARKAAARVRARRRVLITCSAGLNRSGFVTALTLTELYGISGRVAVKWVRTRRDGALFNSEFVAAIRRVPATRLGS